MVDPRRVGRVRWDHHRSAPLQPERPRVLAAHLGDRASGHRLDHRLQGRELCPRRTRAEEVARMRLPPMDVAGRAVRLRERLDVDEILVTKLVNIRSLTGFTGSAALLLV